MGLPSVVDTTTVQDIGSAAPERQPEGHSEAKPHPKASMDLRTGRGGRREPAGSTPLRKNGEGSTGREQKAASKAGETTGRSKGGGGVASSATPTNGQPPLSNQGNRGYRGGRSRPATRDEPPEHPGESEGDGLRQPSRSVSAPQGEARRAVGRAPRTSPSRKGLGCGRATVHQSQRCPTVEPPNLRGLTSKTRHIESA